MSPPPTIGSPPTIKNQPDALKFYNIISSLLLNSSFLPTKIIVSYPDLISFSCAYLNHISNLILHTTYWTHITTSLLSHLLFPILSLSLFSPLLDITIDPTPIFLLPCLSSLIYFIFVPTGNLVLLGVYASEVFM